MRTYRPVLNVHNNDEGRGWKVVAAYRRAYLRGVLGQVCSAILSAWWTGRRRRLLSPEEIDALAQAAVDNAAYRVQIMRRRAA